jgi:hypothetical protein
MDDDFDPRPVRDTRRRSRLRCHATTDAGTATPTELRFERTTTYAAAPTRAAMTAPIAITGTGHPDDESPLSGAAIPAGTRVEVVVVGGSVVVVVGGTVVVVATVVVVSGTVVVVSGTVVVVSGTVVVVVGGRVVVVVGRVVVVGADVVVVGADVVVVGGAAATFSVNPDELCPSVKVNE